MAANIIGTRQKEYINSMAALLSVFEGGHLRKFGVKQENLVGEKAIFYRSSGGSSTRNTRNMYAAGYTGQGGKLEPFEVEPDYILWDDKIQQKELWKTKLDAKSEIIRLGINQLKVDEDKLIMQTISANTNLATAGNVTKDLNTLLRTLIAQIADSILSSKMAIDSANGTVMVLNKTAYKIIAASNASIKSDFITNQMELSKGNVPRMFMGCDMVTFPDDVLSSGEILLIPYGTFGFASWKGSERQNAQYDDRDLHMYLTADTTAGVGVLDAKAITRFSYDPLSKPSTDLIV